MRTVLVHPYPFVYVIGEMPPEMPETDPIVDTVAIAVFPLLQIPPANELDRSEFPPAHKVVLPVIAKTGLTVTVVVIEQPPGMV